MIAYSPSVVVLPGLLSPSGLMLATLMCEQYEMTSGCEFKMLDYFNWIGFKWLIEKVSKHLSYTK